MCRSVVCRCLVSFVQTIVAQHMRDTQTVVSKNVGASTGLSLSRAWLRCDMDSRAVTITPTGHRAFKVAFGVDTSGL